MSAQTLAQLAGSAGPPASAAPPRRPATKSPRWLTRGLLALACAVLVALACASAWLSYHAQGGYVLAHNGNEVAQARVWALLLDVGTAGVSLLRLYETLCSRRGAATRISLLGCIAASVTMNLLHTASRTTGGYLVAAVPPVMYAAFLEHLLANLRSILIVNEQRRTLWRTLVLWVNFPALMWSTRRGSLRRDAKANLTALELPHGENAARLLLGVEAADEVAQCDGDPDDTTPQHQLRSPRRGRRPGAKRVAFEAALTDQVRSGDLRLFSEDERERNAAAYQAAASLPAPLSRGAARRYVVQALPRLGDHGPADLSSASGVVAQRA